MYRSLQDREIYLGTIWITDIHKKTKRQDFIFDKVSMNYAMSDMTRIYRKAIDDAKYGVEQIMVRVTLKEGYIKGFVNNPSFVKSCEIFANSPEHFEDCAKELSKELWYYSKWLRVR